MPMPRCQTPLLVVLVSLAAVDGSTSASPRQLPFTYPYVTTPAGMAEIEQYIDVIPTDVVDGAGGASTRLRFDLKTELELGLSERWELGFYLVARQPADGPYAFRGLKQRLRGRFADEGELPVDLGLYLEVSELADTLALEQKLIVAKRFGALMLLGNVSFEQAIPYAGGAAEVVFNPSAGLSWAASPAVSLGLEYRMDGAISKLGQADHYLGPVLMLMKGEYFATIGGYAHLGGESDGDVWIRVLLGIGL